MDRVSINDFHHSMLQFGTKMAFQMDVANTLNGTISVPLLTCKGREDGPIIFAVAGVHGDEFEGMEAIRKVYETLNPNEMKGVFIGVPVSNPWAYDSQTRESSPHIDGKNLARVFPGNANGSPTEILAHHLLELVLRNVTKEDLFIDFHSAGTKYRYVPMVGYRNVKNESINSSREAVRRFGIPNIWLIPNDSGPFNAETAKRGIPTVGTEITGQGGCLDEDVDLYQNGLMNLLRYKGIVPGEKPKYVDNTTYQTDWMLVNSCGFFKSLNTLGSQVVKNQLIGVITDSYGEIIEEIRSNHNGFVWAVRTFSSIRENDISFLIAYENGSDNSEI